MRGDKIEHKKGLSGLLTAIAIIAVLAFNSCEKEGIKGSPDSVTLYPFMMNEVQTAVNTRAASYITYSGSTRETVYAFAVAFANGSRNAEYDKTGSFNAMGDGLLWRSTVMVIPDVRYNLYCYTSIPGASNYAITFNHKEDIVLSFNNLDLLGTNDPLICTSAYGNALYDNINYTDPDGEDYQDPTGIYPSVQEMQDYNRANGIFDIGTIVRSDNTENLKSTRVFLTMDHLFAKATINFNVAAAYDKIRTIKITQALLSLDNGTIYGSHNYNYGTKTLTLETGSSGQQAKVVLIDLLNGLSSTVTKDTDNKVVLETTAKEFGWFTFLPNQKISNLSLTVHYDVYDKNGNLIRENQTATNNNLFTVLRNSSAGFNYIINVTVNPTYLYQLSDDEIELELSIGN